jgi:uncharacterized membrane protein YccC
MLIIRCFLALLRGLKNPLFLYQRHRHIHAARVMLAFLCGCAIDIAFAVPYGSWTLVTIVVLLGNVPTQGEVSKKSGQRILGTFIGGLAGLVAVSLYLISPWLCFAWMGFIVFLSAYHAIAEGGYAALIAGVTLVIVGGLGDAALEESLWRLGNVLLGASVAFVFASVLPLRAIDRWRFLLAENLREAAFVYGQLGLRSSADVEAALYRFNARMIEMRSLMASSAKECQYSEAPFEQVQRGQRTMLIILERMCVEVQAAPQRPLPPLQAGIFRRLMRAARGLRFLQRHLLEKPVQSSVFVPTELTDFLTLELSQTVDRLYDELNFLMPSILRIQQPLALLRPAALRYLRK